MFTEISRRPLEYHRGMNHEPSSGNCSLCMTVDILLRVSRTARAERHCRTVIEAPGYRGVPTEWPAGTFQRTILDSRLTVAAWISARGLLQHHEASVLDSPHALDPVEEQSGRKPPAAFVAAIEIDAMRSRLGIDAIEQAAHPTSVHIVDRDA